MRDLPVTCAFADARPTGDRCCRPAANASATTWPGGAANASAATWPGGAANGPAQKADFSHTFTASTAATRLPVRWNAMKRGVDVVWTQ
jgi:hypothetical protein